MHRTVHFDCSSADEWEHDESGEPVAPGGKNVADQLAMALASAAQSVSDVLQHEDYGWGFWSRYEGRSFYQVVNAIEKDVHFGIGMSGFLFHRILLRKPLIVFDRYCAVVDRVLSSMNGVSRVCWDGYRR